MQLELWLEKKSKFPIELASIARLKGAQVMINLTDYNSMSSLVRDDLVLWNTAVGNVQAEANS